MPRSVLSYAAWAGHARLRYLLGHAVGVTAVLAALAWAAQRSGLDLALAAWCFDPAAGRFPWNDSPWLELLGHRLVLALPVGVALAALAGASASYRVSALRPWRPALWAIVLTCALGQVLIAQLKHWTALPRPYDLAMFGGKAALPAHWWAASRAEAGGALPSGHAGAGFALLALYFAGWARGRPHWRWGGLAAGTCAGGVFAAVRILQGAHFLSQTLWSAALMWLLASLCFYPVLARARPGGVLAAGSPLAVAAATAGTRAGA